MGYKLFAINVHKDIDCNQGSVLTVPISLIIVKHVLIKIVLSATKGTFY